MENFTNDELKCISVASNKAVLPVCEHPRIILNRACVPYILLGATYFLGDDRKLSFHSSEFIFNKRILPHILSQRDFVSKDNFDKYYVLYNDEIIPIFQYVPCGHCDACQHKKKFSFAQMCQFETLSHSFCPIFGTLTYDNEHLPKKRIYSLPFLCDYQKQFTTVFLTLAELQEYLNQFPADNFPKGSFDEIPTLCSRDVQLFLKRFRQNLKRKFNGKYDFPLRYAICGEHGKKNNRPHYHFIFWNLHCHNHTEYTEICDLIYESWQNGFVSTRVVDVRKNDKCFEYTAKYVAKSGESKSMRLSSKRDGGIGKPFLLSRFADFLSKSLNNSPMYYFDQFTSNIQEVIFTSRVQQILAPSWSRLVPCFVRDAFKELSYYLPSHKLVSVAKKYMFIPQRLSHDVTKFKYESADECVYHIARFFEPLGGFDSESIDILLDSFQRTAVRNSAFLLTRFSRVKSESRSALLYRYKQYEQRSQSLQLGYASIYE